MTDEKGVGSLPDAGTIEPGDPGHIETHDEMARLVQVAADSLGIILDPPAPKPAVIGQYGHVDAHNTLLANIEQLAEAGGGGLPGELPGLGGWATLTAVTGSPQRYAYNDGQIEWVVFEWYEPAYPVSPRSGSVTTTGGIVDCLLVGSGVGHIYATCATVIDAELQIPGGELAITLGYANGSSAEGSETDTRIVPVGATDLQRDTVFWSGYTAYFDGIKGRTPNGQYSSITGTEVLYGHCPAGSVPALSPPGWGGQNGQNTPGAVIIRVPAEQAAGVDPGSWLTRIDYYAEVTDGIVTDTYQERFYGDDSVRTENGRYASPEQPDDLIPCDPSVAEGWSYDGKDFTPPPPPPPPSRDEIIAELQARMDELTKDKK